MGGGGKKGGREMQKKEWREGNGKGKTKWKEELQKTVGWRLTKSKNKERDYCLHNSLGTRLVYIVTINCSTA